MTAFAGRPITGDITHYGSEPRAQDDPQLLLDALDQLLAVPGVQSVRWSQYTPYFNDGDACVFNVYDAYVRIVGDDSEAGDYEDGYRNSYELWEPGPGGYRDQRFGEIAGHPAKPIHDALERFERILQSERHDVALRKNFGDPAQVTATTAGFDVEFYDHD